MNTAPKLLEKLPSLATLDAVDDDERSGRRPCPLNNFTIADVRALHSALAPPSGEGVEPSKVTHDAALAQALREACALYESQGKDIEHCDVCIGVLLDRTREILRTAATPQSAPVDGDAVQQALLVINDAENDARHRGDYARANALVRARVTLYRASATPPPASQERGGDREVLLYLMQQFDCETWECERCGHSEDCKTMDSAEYLRRYLAASPPSSAAEASINSHEIDSKLIPGAAEGAKPDGDAAIREQYRDGTFTRYFGMQPSEQAQAGESLLDRAPALTNEQQGLYRKFDVRRTDGSDQPGGKHHRCEYFVLDVNHDEHAQAALNAYQTSVAKTHPQLARDMRDRYGLQPYVAIEDIEWYAKGLEARDMFAEAALLRRLADGVTSLPESGQSIDDAYWQLIYAVASKYPNETRHETALRYILERESASSSGSTDAMVAALGAK